MKVIKLCPDKEAFVGSIDNTLESMQDFVGGFIQALYPFNDPVAIICNEEGKLLGLETNRALRTPDGVVYDFISGPAFLCGLGEEDFTDFPEELLASYLERFRYPEHLISLNGEIIPVKRVRLDG